MGGFDVKPGATTATDFANANTNTAHTPGKRSAAYEVGEEWFDHGPLCAEPEGPHACFLEAEQRSALLVDFQIKVVGARQNYKAALERIRVDQLIANPAELPWFLSVALDILGTHLLASFTRALKGAVGPSISDLQQTVAPRRLAGRRSGLTFDTTWKTRAQGALAKLTPRGIEELTKAGFDPAKAAANEGLAQQLNNAPDAHEKAQTLSYLDLLGNSADIAFERFRLDTAGYADDAELIVLWHGMKPEFHFLQDYYAALDAKVRRFKKSGVPEIGRTDTDYGHGTLRTETRVILVQDVFGKKTPWYQDQHQDIHDRGHSLKGDPGLGRPVPEEFRDIAIERSEGIWGTTPTIDDGFVQQLKASGQNVEAMRTKLAAYKTQPTEPQATPTNAFVEAFRKSAGAAAPLPPGSVFAHSKPPPYYAPGSVFDAPMKEPLPDPVDPLMPFRTTRP
jgi:hypothetical protein